MSLTVYITNKSPTHDYTSAARFGALRFVTMGNYPVFKTARLQEEITDAIAYSTPDDYILFSGSAAVSALASSIWLEMHGKANILLWDRGNGEYVKRTIDRELIRETIEITRDKLKVGRK